MSAMGCATWMGYTIMFSPIFLFLTSSWSSNAHASGSARRIAIYRDHPIYAAPDEEHVEIIDLKPRIRRHIKTVSDGYVDLYMDLWGNESGVWIACYEDSRNASSSGALCFSDVWLRETG